MSRFVILSGPSCIGKGPLHKALKKFYPHLAARLKPVVLYNSRAPRPDEQDGVDYHFRPLAEIENLRSREGFLVVQVRSDVHALELQSVRDTLDSGNDAFFEGNPYIVAALQDAGHLGQVESVTAFLSPLSRQEITFLQDPAQRVSLEDFVTDVMRRKLLRRTQRQKGVLSLRDLENIEVRAGSAFREMQYAHRYQWVIPNHDGEDSENWDAFYYPVGEARNALLAFADILDGREPDRGEKWEQDFLTSRG
ncbi:MAG: hypothetical protein HY318_04430 [Armatimonadetes bacterium]|nr:hypothetical protein [Armatimonadota bacterium]